MASAIAVEDLTKTYRTGIKRLTRTAVAGLSLEVPAGEIHGLLGPNGAGKTTTLKTIMGFVRPTSGSARVLGQPATSSDVHRRVGFLPEQPYFYGYLRADQTLDFYGRLCGLNRSDRKTRIAELLKLVGLTDSAQMKTSKFSRGMLQRLGIAQALIQDPELVILDEPASGLDPIGQKEMRNVVLELKASGKTVFLSSHQLSEVEAVCDSVSILDRGTLRRQGTLDELLNVTDAWSVRAKCDDSTLEHALDDLVDETIRTGREYTIAVQGERIYDVLGVLERSGAALESVAPKRMRLEDYFIELLKGERHGS